jgi:hypothetical protein
VSLPNATQIRTKAHLQFSCADEIASHVVIMTTSEASWQARTFAISRSSCDCVTRRYKAPLHYSSASQFS